MYNYIDRGFGYLKAIVNGKQIKFANVTGEHQNADDNPLSGQQLSIQVDGLGDWNFGDTARLQSNLPGFFQSSNWLFEPEYLGGVLLAISMGYSPSTHHINTKLITGLPGQDYDRGPEFRQRFKDTLTGEHIIHRNGNKQTISIEKVLLTSQALGPIWNILLNDKGSPVLPDVPDNAIQIGSINVGFNNVEIGTVEVSNLNSPFPKLDIAGGIKGKLSTTDGVHTLIPGYQSTIKQQYGIQFDAIEILAIIENGGFRIDGKWIEFKPDSINQQLTNNIRRSVSSVWNSDKNRTLYQVILTGGGANIIKSHFNHIPQLTVTDKPQWDCVSGYQKLGKLMEKKGK